MWSVLSAIFASGNCQDSPKCNLIMSASRFDPGENWSAKVREIYIRAKKITDFLGEWVADSFPQKIQLYFFRKPGSVFRE